MLHRVREKMPHRGWSPATHDDPLSFPRLLSNRLFNMSAFIANLGEDLQLIRSIVRFTPSNESDARSAMPRSGPSMSFFGFSRVGATNPVDISSISGGMPAKPSPYDLRRYRCRNWMTSVCRLIATELGNPFFV